MSALIASLFAVGAAPATAEEGTADEPPMWTACLGEAVQDHGFTDLGTLEATVPNINCLAYYGITVGKTADTFDPNSNVTRSEMALFLYRAAGLMGVDLMGGDMMVEYGDLADLGEDRQAAITALARNGILVGRSGMAFEPGADITRAEMAVALVNLLDHTPGAPVNKNMAGLFVVGDNHVPDDVFADVYASESQPVNNAISAAYELGITSGVGDGTAFDPSGSVPRRDMATFIVRALNHSNVRPAGLTAQADGGDITVSVRDASFAPVVNQPVDAFYVNAAGMARAFNDDGTCSTRAGRMPNAVEGGSPCVIGLADAVTQSDGNVKLVQIGNEDIGKGVTAWAWMGDIGDKFDADTDAVELSITPGPTTVNATSAVISTDLPEGASRAHFGSVVTVTIQLKGTSNGETVDTGPGEAEVEYSVYMEYFTGATAVGSPSNSGTSSAKVGADGSASFPVSVSDPDGSTRGQVRTVRYTVSRTVVTENTTETSILVPDPDAGDPAQEIVSTPVAPAPTPPTHSHTDMYQASVVFSDEAPVVTAVSVKPDAARVAPGLDGNQDTAATVTVVDQFGKPFYRAPVVLTTSNVDTADGTVTDDDGGSKIPTRARTTGPDGTVRIGYNYRGTAAVETLTAIWNGDTADTDSDGTVESDEGGDDDTGCSTGPTDTTNLDICGTAEVYWIGVSELAASAQAYDVLDLDSDNNRIIVDTNVGTGDGDVTPESVSYDSNDQFNLTTVVDSSDATSPATMADFEAELAKALANAADDNTLATPTLSWTSYDYEDSVDIASFTADVTTS